MKELKARVEDALHATKAAIEEGVVPGGGTALLRTQKAVDKLAKTLEGDMQTGVDDHPPRARRADADDRRERRPRRRNHCRQGPQREQCLDRASTPMKRRFRIWSKPA